MLFERDSPPAIAIPEVAYAQPLRAALEARPDLRLTVMPHEAVADALQSGACVCALVSPAALLRDNTLSVIPGAGVAARGATPTELLLAPAPLEDVRRIAAPPDAAHLMDFVRLLFAERGWEAPALRSTGEDGSTEEGEGVLVSGRAPDGIPSPGRAYDLGELWLETTGFPMVLGVWACGPLAPYRVLRQALGEAARQAQERAAADGATGADGAPMAAPTYSYQILSLESDSIRDLHARARRHFISETIVESIAFC